MTWKCKKNCGECCGLVHFPHKLWQEMKHKAQKTVVSEHKMHATIVPITADGLCVFLTPERTCAIYSKRPAVCEMYGTIAGMPCPYLKSDGTPRARQDKRRIERQINRFVDAKLAKLKQQES